MMESEAVVSILCGKDSPYDLQFWKTIKNQSEKQRMGILNENILSGRIVPL